MTTLAPHHDWLSLIEISGPFLAVPVLKDVFPQGLEELDPGKRKRLRQTYEEWCDAVESGDALIDALHTAWVEEVLARTLELDEDGKGDILKSTEWCAARLTTKLIEHGMSIAPDYAVVDEQQDDAPLMLVHRYAPDVDLNDAQKFDGWTATPAERMVALCRATGCRIGLVTNGERWMLVDAPVGAVTSFASWYARLWGQETVTLQAFVHLLRCGRFFGNDDAKLPALIDRSLKFQDEVTDALGDQVRRAVEVLIQALDKADQDRDRELLRGISEPELYEAALTVMMRLVFLLSAEERGLLLMGDGKYEAHYAISTLRAQLVVEELEILEKRKDAWSRLLATFRAVFGGIEHENLRLPALGGSLFDPDRFPFLEGRSAGTTWRTDPAKPLPIDNRTVLLLLEAIQQFQGRTLSYRALDVEQIGYVYEGLLERTVKRTADVTLDIGATLKAEKPLVTLAELESAKLDGIDRLVALLRERSGSSESRVRNDLAKPVDDALSERLLTACLGDTELLGRIKPYGQLLRTDPWGYPLVYPKGAFVVTTGTDRRETGTHYTPKSLTEAIVTETLTPIAYVGPAEGLPREEWAPKPPAGLLDLKICDPAMGSGAFLVQVCRWLAERLAEAWSRAEEAGHVVSVDGEVLPNGADKELLPRDAEERIVVARRLIAERCLYGVDLNPLAVELAKLSIWLVTLAKDRPFGFLDHNLRCGDSLLGIHRLDQLTQLSMTPNAQGQLRLFGQNIEQAVREAIDLRLRLREMPIRDIRDVNAMASLNAEIHAKLKVSDQIADALIAIVFAVKKPRALESHLSMLAGEADHAIGGRADALTSIKRLAEEALSAGLGNDRPYRPLHWILQFPEVFDRPDGGFDAVIANPPFVDSETMSRLDPEYRDYLSRFYACAKGNWDLYIPFFERALQVSRRTGGVSLISPNKWLAAPYGAALRAQTAQSLSAILNFSRIRAFDGVGVAAICTSFCVEPPPTVIKVEDPTLTSKKLYVQTDSIASQSNWGVLLSPHIDIVSIISSSGIRLGEYVAASDPYTVSEAYQLVDDIIEANSADGPIFKFVNTGTIDPYRVLWGERETRYLKKRFVQPVLKQSQLERRFPKRFNQARQPKLILSGMRNFEAFLDEHGEFVAGKSSVIVIPKNSRLSLLTCLGLLNSRLIRFFLQESYGALGIDGGISFSGNIVESLPLPSGFSGNLPRIDELVRELLSAPAESTEFLNLLNKVDVEIFNTYGLSMVDRKVIMDCDLKC
ncbi:Eco57I restriction-modification methylase domain-containing protein [Laribacter hongkongensis]|uniref:Eco57I restriction-modification methylase domain-containing protein n=1 Tax=Laribacter hongkongensis TaxID=168471 RepID=UPI001EFE3D1C|nr:Eco57I restriction-modification methylase domain-containing protein [Laribacter hongkongensis]MCG9114358.1 Eco57I restriction-modification methylase domain-containing protein [Laribacter hongkongensis]